VIRPLVRLGVVGLGAAWAIDRVLRNHREGQVPPAIESLVVIDAPIERVWTELADIEGQPRWMHDMKDVHLTTPPPVGVGTRGVSTVRVFGIGVTDPVTITEFQPPTRFALRHEGAVSGSGVITLEPGADGTTTIVRWEERLVAPFLPDLGAEVLGRVFGPIFQADLFRLRDLVESGTG
jgi:uncharacterized protein YndB with AHSA1/START domain